MPATILQKATARPRRPKYGPGVSGLIRAARPRRPRPRGPQNLGRGNLFQNYRPGAQQQPGSGAIGAGANGLPGVTGVHPGPVVAGAAAPAAAPVAPAGPVDPRDAQYWGDFSNFKQQRDNQFADIGRSGADALTDRDDSITRLIDQRKQSLLNTKRGDAARGLFYSTTLTNDNRDVNRGYDDQESGVRTAFDRGEAERAAARRDLELQYGKGDDLGSTGATLLRDAIQRQIDRNVAAPLPNVPAPAAKAPARPKKAAKPKHKKRGHR